MKEEAIIKAVVANLRSALKKKFPSLVHEIQFSFGSDKDGQDAIFVTVILKDRKKGDYRWDEVQPLEQTIREKVASGNPFRFPYVGFELASEQAAS